MIQVLNYILSHSRPNRWYLWGMVLAVCFIVIDNTFKPFLVKMLVDRVSTNNYKNIWVICLYYSLLQLILVRAWGLSDYCMISYTSKFRC
jgi:ATP-binding cassette subfamily B protein